MQEIFNFFFKTSSFFAGFLPFRHNFLGFSVLPIALRVISVRLTGLEPARLSTPDPKSDASTNSATGALAYGARQSRTVPLLGFAVQRYNLFFIPPKVYVQILSLNPHL